MERTDWDVIIVGTGAGGGTLAARLASTGKRILLLERGEYLPREPENWSEDEVVNKSRYRTTEQWLDSEEKPFAPFTHYWVGGNTKMYGAALFRLRAHDFEETRHIDGSSPAWPLRYTDFEPYYTRAEQLYHVHGLAGVDPTEPARTSAYPHGPLAHEPRIHKLASALSAAGYHPFAMPMGVRLPEDTPGTRAPLRLGAFDGFPDPTESKADAHVVGVAAALAYPNVELRTGTLVERLLTGPSGREITGVVARDVHGLHTLRAALVVLSCGAIQSAALLLRSRNDAHPRGLANHNDLVGRHYMTHNNGALIAYGKSHNDARFQKTFALTDFYRGTGEQDPPLGAVQLMGRTDLATLRGLFREPLPHAADSDLTAHTLDFWLTAEDLPRADNRVTLAADGRVQLHYTPNNREAYRRLRLALEAALRRAEPEENFVFAGYQLGIAGVSHQCGTLRFGRDPDDSVLDVWCRAHAIDNLYVVDASFFRSSGALNPSLTIMANALRVGDHLAERLA